MRVKSRCYGSAVRTTKMYFSGRNRASKFPTTWEAEERPVIQPNTAALLLSCTVSAYKMEKL